MPRGGPTAARIRAAHAYSDLTRQELGAKIGLSARQLGRLEDGTATADPYMRERIADACGVPRVFLEVGFAPLDEPIADVDRRVYAIEERLGRIEEMIPTADELLGDLLPALETYVQGRGQGQEGSASRPNGQGRPPRAGGGGS